jgi:hypothetical protein
MSEISFQILVMRMSFLDCFSTARSKTVFVIQNELLMGSPIQFLLELVIFLNSVIENTRLLTNPHQHTIRVKKFTQKSIDMFSLHHATFSALILLTIFRSGNYSTMHMHE